MSVTSPANLSLATEAALSVQGAGCAAPGYAGQRVSLSPEASALLNATRAFAAIYVVIHHVSVQFNFSPLADLPFRFGQEAVILFFLLSGFVVHTNERNRALHPTGYYARRIRRIYPVLIAAMLITAAVMADNGSLGTHFTLTGMFGTLFALQDISALKPGVIVDPFLGNAPLWSLSYEIAFYAIYPFVLRSFVKQPIMTSHLVGLVCSIAFSLFILAPDHFLLVTAYFVIWWTGAMAAEAYSAGQRSWRGIAVPLAWLLVLSLVALGAVAREGWHGPGVYPALMLRHFAFALGLSFLAFGPIGAVASRWANRFPVMWSTVAGIAFGIYVLHYPILLCWERPVGVVGWVAAVILMIGLSWLVEQKLPTLLPKASRA